ncbi:MAG: primosomal protein N' [Desulfobacterales bacterium]
MPIPWKGKSVPEAVVYKDIAVALPVYNTYTYGIPANLLPFAEEGRRVLIPFGHRKVTGYILGSAEKMEKGTTKLILDVLDDKFLFPKSMIPFFRWIAEYYKYPVGEVIKKALPGGINLYDYAELSITPSGKKQLSGNTLPPAEKKVLKLLESGAVLQKTLQRKFQKETISSLIQRMVEKGVIEKKLLLKGKSIGPREEKFLSFVNADIPKDRFYEKRKQIIDLVKKYPEGISLKELKANTEGAEGYTEYLVKNSFLSEDLRNVFRDPLGEPVPPDTPPQLTQEQEKAVSAILRSMGKGFTTYLLSGVTGSGKTEVYMRIAESAVKKGYSALVLVPEIALISQTERRFRARFGECIAVLHSGLSAGERYDQWLKILEKKVKIVIGARSAVFAPVTELGVIIVDEEHDSSYKQESSLRYHARDIAIVRAKQQNAIALLGSATPSIQSAFNADLKKFDRLYLTKRINDRPLPEVTVVDLCRYRDERGLRRFITPELIQEVKKNLERGEQVLLFLNRRGFANFPVCASCGEPMLCKNCDISLTLHKGINAYKCHFCGYTRASVSACGKCGSPAIKLLGIGTEKVAAAMENLFPDARITRMDRDTTVKKGSMVTILKELRKNKIDILIGTQMVAKGHDFPNITLVGIICADLSLNFPDFRASELTFQILAQVAGRAGRGNIKGRVILQTYNPNHFSITAAQDQDYERFYSQEIVFRKALNYPPFSRIVQLKISGRDKRMTKTHALFAGERCKTICRQERRFQKDIEILGPVEAPFSKIAGYFRWHILLKGTNTGTLHSFVSHLMFEHLDIIQNRNVRVVVDVDPIFML